MAVLDVCAQLRHVTMLKSKIANFFETIKFSKGNPQKI